MHVVRIFTDNSISPSLSPRQRPDRYAFRAGRNLPDKEFRYLRTVIVTAAVHRGFNSELAPLLLTFRHWAGVSPYTSPFGFAQTCVFGKQSVEPFRCDPLAGASLLPKLRDLFAEFLNEGSPVRLRVLHASTCVGLGYGRRRSPLPTFSCTPVHRLLACARHHGHEPLATSLHLEALLSRAVWVAPIVGTGIFTGCPSTTRFRFALGPTHPTRTDLASEPLDGRRARFSLALRYSCLHSHSMPLQQPLPDCLLRCIDAPLPVLQLPSFGGTFQPRCIFRADTFDQ